jgi:hypothetical protein
MVKSLKEILKIERGKAKKCQTKCSQGQAEPEVPFIGIGDSGAAKFSDEPNIPTDSEQPPRPTTYYATPAEERKVILPEPTKTQVKIPISAQAVHSVSRYCKISARERRRSRDRKRRRSWTTMSENVV